jgi:hypothetical protein
LNVLKQVAVVVPASVVWRAFAMVGMWFVVAVVGVGIVEFDRTLALWSAT